MQPQHPPQQVSSWEQANHQLLTQLVAEQKRTTTAVWWAVAMLVVVVVAGALVGLAQV